MQTSVIIDKRAGKDIPGKYLESALNSYSAFCSVTAIADKQFHVSAVDSPLDPKVFQEEVLPQIKDLDAVLFLANESDNENTLQPFVALQNLDDTPAVLVFMEGPFLNKETTKEAHEVFEEYLQKKISDLYDLCDTDLDKLFAFLEKPSNRADIESTYGLRGAILILSCQGHKVKFATAGKEFDWGYVTNKLDYSEEEPAKEEPEAPAKKKFSLFGSKSKETKAEAADPPADTTKKEDGEKKPTVVDKGLTVGDVAANADTAVKLVHCPSEIWNTKDPKKKKNRVKNFYKEFLGVDIGERWLERPSFPASRLKKPLPLELADAMIIKELTGKEVAAKTGAATPVEEKKEPVRSETDRYVLSATHKEAISEFIAGLDEAKTKVPDPTKVNAAEEKYPSFCEQNGIYLEDTLGWSVDDLETLGLKSMEGLVLLALEYRAHYVKTLSLTDMIGTSKPEEKTEEEPVTEPVKTSEPETSTKKFSLFGNKKKVA